MTEQTNKKLNQREYRFFTNINLAEVENEVGEKKELVRGFATTFNQPYEMFNNGEVRILEIVDRNAFDKTDFSDVIMQYNHKGRVFARTKNNTLKLTVEEKGLAIEADLDGTDIGRQLKQEIRGGYTDKMSIGFGRVEDVWDERNIDGVKEVTRRIISVGKLFDVSAVSTPANDYTSISVRNLTDGVLERLQAERLVAETEIRNKKIKRLEIELLTQGVK